MNTNKGKHYKCADKHLKEVKKYLDDKLEKLKDFEEILVKIEEIANALEFAKGTVKHYFVDVLLAEDVKKRERGEYYLYIFRRTPRGYKVRNPLTFERKDILIKMYPDLVDEIEKEAKAEEAKFRQLFGTPKTEKQN